MFPRERIPTQRRPDRFAHATNRSRMAQATLRDTMAISPKFTPELVRSTPEPQKSTAKEASRNSRKLSSWKEVAVYLGREVRTVQRWEKSAGLPIHRLLHAERGSVFAYTAELDRWLASRSAVPETAEPVSLASEAPTWRT